MLGSMVSPSAHPAPAPSEQHRHFRERLLPGVGGFAAILGFAFVTFVALSVVSLRAAWVTGVVVGVAGLVAAWLTAPVVAVRDGELHAGRAHLPARLLGPVEVLDRDGVRATMGPGYDPRAFVCLRAWIGGAVVAPVTDPADPTPTWLISSRRPRALAAAIEAARAV